jgi:hypothetical protein
MSLFIKWNGYGFFPFTVFRVRMTVWRCWISAGVYPDFIGAGMTIVGKRE